MNASSLRAAARIACCLSSLLFASPSAAQHDVRVAPGAPAGAEPVVFPDTPQGRAARAWFRAFHGSVDDMRAVHRDHFAPGSRTIEERLAVWRDLREQAGSLTPMRVRETPRGLEVIARNGDGERVRIDFQFEPSPPQRILGLRIAPVEEGEDDDAAPATPLTEAQAIDTIEARVASLVANDRFSGVARVERGGRVVLERAWGLADREKRIPNAADTKFNVGSINKMFTKTVIAKLVEQGKIGLDDPLAKHLPDFPRDKADRITIRQLLDMRSGLGDFFGPRYDAADKSKLRDPRDWFPLFQDDSLLFEPGSSSRYSNAGYAVLGAVAEAVTGRSYYELVREIVYRPAGMTGSDSYAVDESVANRAEGYTRRGAGELRSNRDELPGRGSSAGGGYSTAADLSRFMDALVAGKLVKAEVVEQVFGARRRPDGALELEIGFAGGAPGVNAIVLNLDGNRIVVLANLDPPAAESLGSWVRKTLGRVKG